MNIVIASDHAGFALKGVVKAYLTEKGYTVIDCGTDSEASCDYPVFAKALCKEINDGNAQLGILICGTGIGMSMAANKVKGIRAALCSDCFSAKFTRAHNDSNVMCLGARVMGEGLALELVDIFLNTPFEGGKHLRRINMLED
ncbi:MAG: ribose 5-phosphate isomerase B [Clostridia bacterium]|nr:ribose 5-phosphate isomerase B [Clostridia bacterium]MBQ5821437.1 ribose 5-phosphate isomerase B [Clostridia bacterium]